MTIATLVWATPNADAEIGYCARVSNPNNQDNPNVEGLLRYCAEHHHWSIFEMASLCLEINTSRDIGRQILRHRSFSFQEMSYRYATVAELPPVALRECRLQDTKNRQNSIECDEEWLRDVWSNMQDEVMMVAKGCYENALSMGIAKEQARALLPEGLAPSRLYVSGTIRSWITYLQVRLHPSTQKEHRLVAEQALAVLREVAPVTTAAFFPETKD